MQDNPSQCSNNKIFFFNNKLFFYADNIKKKLKILIRINLKNVFLLFSHRPNFEAIESVPGNMDTQEIS